MSDNPSDAASMPEPVKRPSDDICDEILRERQRQEGGEGYSTKHDDDEHAGGELGIVAYDKAKAVKQTETGS